MLADTLAEGLDPDDKYDQPIFDILLPFHEGKLTAEATATAITQLMPDGEATTNVWVMVLDAAEGYPETHGDLIQLLFALKKHVIYDSGTTNVKESFGRKYWEDLPHLGWDLRDHFDPPASDPDQTLKRKKWANINAFVARVTVSGCMPVMQFGLWTLQSLEKVPWENDPYPNDKDKNDWLRHQASIELLDGDVPAAAQWMAYAGGVLFKEAKTQICKHEKIEESWAEHDHCCIQRWEHWKSQFKWISGVELLQEVTRREARMAAERMDCLEMSSNDIVTT